jgi:hypothetical protein
MLGERGDISGVVRSLETTGGSWKIHAKTPECWSFEVMHIFDLRTLQYPFQSSDQPRWRNYVQHFGEVILQEERSVEKVETPQMSKLLINMSHRFMDIHGHTSTMGSKGYWETAGEKFRL